MTIVWVYYGIQATPLTALVWLRNAGLEELAMVRQVAFVSALVQAVCAVATMWGNSSADFGIHTTTETANTVFGYIIPCLLEKYPQLSQSCGVTSDTWQLSLGTIPEIEVAADVSVRISKHLDFRVQCVGDQYL